MIYQIKAACNMRMAEKVRKALEKIVKEVTTREGIYGVGFFGSWSRGDADESSDVDLLVIDGRVVDEYIVRTTSNGLFVDLNFIPKDWIRGVIPPELDQTLYEAKVLYDRDWSLADAKMLMAKIYGLPERVELRFRTHIMESDIYFSRAASAIFRGDFRSAQLYAKIAAKEAVKGLMEIAQEPISESRFLHGFEAAAEKLGKKEIFKRYLEIAETSDGEENVAKEKLRLLKAVWDELSYVIRQHTKEMEKMHFKIKSKIEYYFNPLFLQGAILRADSLIATKSIADAIHYLDGFFFPMMENYAWLKAAIEKKRLGYICLMDSLEKLEKKNPRNYQNIIEFFDLAHLEKEDAAETVKKVRNFLLEIRAEGKILIKNHISKS